MLLVYFALVYYYILSSVINNGSTFVAENLIVPQKQSQTNIGLPIRLKIPIININSMVEQVGITSDGSMDVPTNLNEVAWFKLGQRPGEIGSAIISGHYGILKNGQTSAFDNLHKLRSGDKIYIENDRGLTITFVVRESKRYDGNADATNVFTSNDQKSHLNLITCEGVWDDVSKSYSKRLVVFADKE